MPKFKNNSPEFQQLLQEKGKLNLGAGTDIREDYVNIDIQKFPEIDYLADITDLSFINTDTIEYIVLQHVLEHIPRAKMLNVLYECKRVLKFGQVLEIRVTDLSSLTKAMYLNNISPELGMHSEMVIALLYGQQLDEYDTRYNGFTSEYLQGILKGCGFTIIGCVKEDLDVIISARKDTK